LFKRKRKKAGSGPVPGNDHIRVVATHKKFKPFNLNSLGKEPASGSLHPLLKVRE